MHLIKDIYDKNTVLPKHFLMVFRDEMIDYKGELTRLPGAILDILSIIVIRNLILDEIMHGGFKSHQEN